MSEELEHIGVIGMKWGHRKQMSVASNAPQRLSRKEYRVKVRQDRNKFYNDKANSLIKESLKNPQVLISLHTNGSSYPTVVTGKEFVKYMASGGMMNIKATDVYARQATKTGPYILNENGSRVYTKPKR